MAGEVGVIGQYKSPRASTFTHEENQMLAEYAAALGQLVWEHRRYNANVDAWKRWNNTQRLAWVYWLEEQAELNPPLPLAQAIVARVLTNKLTS